MGQRLYGRKREEMNPQWSDEVKEKYIKDQAFYAECTARGIQIRLNIDTLNWEGNMTRPIGISVPHRRVEEDDDIQDYKKPWVGLTDEDRKKLAAEQHDWEGLCSAVEAKLRSKNT
jgi:hypothetical protein